MKKYHTHIDANETYCEWKRINTLFLLLIFFIMSGKASKVVLLEKLFFRNIRGRYVYIKNSSHNFSLDFITFSIGIITRIIIEFEN